MTQEIKAGFWWFLSEAASSSLDVSVQEMVVEALVFHYKPVMGTTFEN